MRPIFAIVPLAIVLALIGPTQPDVRELLGEFKARVFPTVAEPSPAPALTAEAPLGSAFAASSVDTTRH